MSTGFPHEDAKSSFARERRRQALAKIAARLRFEPDDVSAMVPFEEAVAALGRVGERDLGVQEIPLDTIVGSVDRRRGEFDRAFRPAISEVRGRWERISLARRRGETMPPIDVYRVGDMHFVRDGHHRVSVARSMGDTTIEARVREVQVKVGADPALRTGDLPLKAHERVFFERVPLSPERRRRIQLTDEWRFVFLASLIESWGYRASLQRQHLLSREEVAEAWFTEEYEPVTEVLREADIGGAGTETERFLRIALLRFLLLQTHEWTDEIVERLLGQIRASPGDDTLVHQIIKEMR